MARGVLQSERIKVQDSLEQVNRLFYAREWSDGLPIIPPTEERVQKMLEGTSRKPDEVLGKMPPKYGICTVEKIAINAVMAGCLPSYLPILITAVEIMVDPSFNLYALQATTHPVAPMLLVNGPIVKEIDMSFGAGCFGPGTWANATLGRAIRLILWNIGGGVAGKLDRATQGQPSKYSYCIAENEDENPWEPLHVERGFSKDTNTVTVCPVAGPHNIQDHENNTAVGVMTVMANSMINIGINNIFNPSNEAYLCFGPEHAQTVAGEGWTKEDVKHFIQEFARLPLSKVRLFGGYKGLRQWPKYLDAQDGDAQIPIVTDWRNVVVIVAGGAGKHSCTMPTFGFLRSVTKAVKP